MDLPLLDDLIPEQMDVYDADLDDNLFILGPPGSGKTTLAVFRMRQLNKLKRSAVLITRNRMLVSLATQLGEGEIEAKTMHVFFAKAFSDQFGYNAPENPRYNFDWPAIMRAYQQAGKTPVLEHLIIDEGQNLPAGFFTWSVRFGAKTVSVFADEDQTTLLERASIREILDAPMPNPIRLSENHRNTREIARIAEHFHRSNTLPPAIVRRQRAGETPRLQRISTWTEAVQIIGNRFTNRGGSIGVIVRYVQEAEHVKDLLIAQLPPNARIDIYTNRNPKGSEQKIHLMTPGITVLTSESSIGLEFDAVYLQDLARSLPCVNAEQHRRMYMLCARARDHLTLLDGPTPLTQLQISSLPAPILLTR